MEINDKKIYKIALITSLVGIIGLVIFSGFITAKEIPVNKIDHSRVEEEVSVVGVIESVKKSSTSETYFLTLNDGTGKINIIIFESTTNELKESGTDIDDFNNKKVKIIGTITQYKSSIEIILKNANSIKIIN